MRYFERRIIIFICSILFAFTAILPDAVNASSGSVKLYYNSNLSVGLTTSMQILLSGQGYSAAVSPDPSTTTLSAALSGINKIVFVHSYGSSASPIIQCSNGNLTPGAVTSSNIKFAYLSTCYSSKVYSSGVSFRQRMTALGVPMTVGFQDTISATYSYDGIHFFNNRVISYMTQGYTLINALSMAQADTYSSWGTFAGSNFVVFTGGTSHLP